VYGRGFTTIALAHAAAHVITAEIDRAHHAQARQNVAKVGLTDRVTFVLADIMDEEPWRKLPRVDAAFLDPDSAVTGLIMFTVSRAQQLARSSTSNRRDTVTNGS
jgi:tRNA A58 N-methylase Trm61